VILLGTVLFHAHPVHLAAHSLLKAGVCPGQAVYCRIEPACLCAPFNSIRERLNLVSETATGVWPLLGRLVSIQQN
jgi:hypothetical protein